MNERRRTGNVTIRRVAAAVTAVSVLCGPAAGAAPPADPQPGTPEWHLRAVQNNLDSRGRTVDQLSNPDYLARSAAALERCAEAMDDLCQWQDPYRFGWELTRGRKLDISYPNRYGVTIRGHLWAPPDGRVDPITGQATSSFPAVILVNGGGAVDVSFLGIAQGLAEAGYLVMTFDQQCEGTSDCQPAPEHCNPEGTWRDPQEAGLRERGPCAGQDPPGDDVEFVHHATECLTVGCSNERLREGYDAVVDRRALGALDAVGWLLSEENPWRGLIAGDGVGVAGVSFGAHAALLAANGDPLGRFSAVAAFDGYGIMPESIPPRVPTMFQAADSEETGGPYESPPDPDAKPSRTNQLRFLEAGIDTMLISLRGSTHQEWTYTPWWGAAAAGQFVASSYGERVALYYTQAWFDRWLKDATHAEDARRRLLSPVFDASVDGSSIGQGTWDPVRQANAPYTVAGRPVDEHLSFYYRSAYAFDGVACEDMRKGCP